jgi:hypothetical protein
MSIPNQIRFFYVIDRIQREKSDHPVKSCFISGVASGSGRFQRAGEIYVP